MRYTRELGKLRQPGSATQTIVHDPPLSGLYVEAPSDDPTFPTVIAVKVLEHFEIVEF